MRIRFSGTITLVSLILLSGCAGLQKSQEVNLNIYKNKIQKECVKKRSPEKTYNKKYSDDSINELCQLKADDIMDGTRFYFLLYNEDKLLNKCKNKDKILETKCLKKYQNEYYDKAVAHAIKKRL